MTVLDKGLYLGNVQRTVSSGGLKVRSCMPMPNRDASTVNQVWTMPTVPGPKLAQQVADEREVINMLYGSELDRIVSKHQPTIPRPIPVSYSLQIRLMHKSQA